jgi:phage gpG-like protein
VTQLTINVEGVAQVAADLEEMVARAHDARPAFHHIGDRLALSEREHFASEGASTGAGFSPLSPPYAAFKLRAVGPQPILRFSGRLEDTLTRRPFAVDEETAVSGTWGTNVPYAAFHQRGTSRMPARPPLRVSGKELARWAGVIARWITAGHTGGGGDVE